MYNLTYKSIDVMKKTKDLVNAQITTVEKTSLATCIKTLGATHIAISTPLDDNTLFVANSTTPTPRTIEAETQDWCDVIHTAGLKVIHRGTFCGTENIWNFAYDTATPLGSAASAATDGNSTWCGRYYRYLYLHVGSHVSSGDVFAPIPEGTTHSFDGHWFVSSQANYAALFASFHTITTTYAAAQGVTITFMSHNNYSEVRSGYIPGSLFTDQLMVGMDYYGQFQGSGYNSPANYVQDLNAVYALKTQPMFHSEWGDLPGAVPSSVVTVEDRLSYLVNFYQMYRDNLVPPNGNVIGFNYWGGWEGQNTSILYKDVNGKYQPNARGKILAAFYLGNGLARVPVTNGTSILTATF